MSEAEQRFASVTNALGRTLYFDPDEMRGRRMSSTSGNYNAPSLELWNFALRLRDWDVVVDVGCNYGEMIVGASIPPGASIIAYEPNPTILGYLEKTLQAYGRPVDLRRSAVSDEVVHDAQFARDVTWSGKSSLIVERREDTAGDEIVFDSVEVSTLDLDLGTRFTSACIKVDVEGKEDAVLRGAMNALAGMDGWAMMIEILHMGIAEIAELIADHYFYLLDRRSNEVVRVVSTNPAVLEELFSAWWIYTQDALLLSGPIRAGALASVPGDAGEIARLREGIDELTLSTSRIISFRDSFIDGIFRSRSWRVVNPARTVAKAVRRISGRP